MKVLMFGGEFPPHISGGLGTACYGLTKGLVSFDDIDLTFVVPKAYRDEDKQGMKLIGASDVELSGKVITRQENFEKKRFHEFDQRISAYTTPEQYEKILSEQHNRSTSSFGNVSYGKLEFKGSYANNYEK